MRVNIYIRKEDEEAWANIPDKPQWIHDGLNKELLLEGKWLNIKELKVVNTPAEIDPILIPQVAKNIDRYSNGLCKIHSTPLDSRGKCLQKGCRYA